jgi:hypothetical protein
MMSPEPPPLPAPARFTLPIPAWVAWVIYAVVRIVVFVWRNPSPSPYAWGELIGGIVTLLLLPLLITWIVWKVSDRSRLLLTGTFLGVLVLGIGGQMIPSAMQRVTQLQRRAEANVQIQKLAEENKALRAKQRATLAKGGNVDEKGAEELARRTSAQMVALAKATSGSDRASAEAASAYMDALLATKKRYDEAANALKGGALWDLARLDSLEATAGQRTVVQTFAQVNEELTAFQDEKMTAFRRELEQRQVPAATVEVTLAAARASAGARLQIVGKIRALDGDLAKTLLAYIDLAEANIGKTKTDAETGKVRFEEPAAVAKQRELLAHAQKIAAEQADYQKKMFAPGR